MWPRCSRYGASDPSSFVDRLGTLNAADAAAGDGRLPAGIGRGVCSGSLDGDAAEGEGEHAAVLPLNPAVPRARREALDPGVLTVAP